MGSEMCIRDRPGDGLESIRRRGLTLEYEVYAQSIRWLAAGQVHMETSSSRPKTTITDPAYPEILKSWTALAFGNHQKLK